MAAPASCVGRATVTVVRVRVGRDPCVVLTAALARLVQKWIDRWNDEHPDLRPRFAPPRRGENGHFAGNTVVGALTILGERVAQVGPPLERHALGAVVYTKNRYTELRVADQLLTAIEHTPDVFYDGTLLVFPNPRVEDSDRRCCGSFTGVQF